MKSLLENWQPENQPRVYQSQIFSGISQDDFVHGPNHYLFDVAKSRKFLNLPVLRPGQRNPSRSWIGEALQPPKSNLQSLGMTPWSPWHLFLMQKHRASASRVIFCKARSTAIATAPNDRAWWKYFLTPRNGMIYLFITFIAPFCVFSCFFLLWMVFKTSAAITCSVADRFPGLPGRLDSA